MVMWADKAGGGKHGSRGNLGNVTQYPLTGHGLFQPLYQRVVFLVAFFYPIYYR